MSSSITVPDSFGRIAKRYDSAPNPLLRLEERFLSGILPQLRGLDVLDVGCGTGRWLHLLADSCVNSLTGIDPSEAMLAIATTKLSQAIVLKQGSAEQLPVAANSADVVLLSFVLSYCRDLEALAQEIARVARSGASVVISDMHPITEARLGWTRSFRTDDATSTLFTERHDLDRVKAVFAANGFERLCHLELPFGAPEEEVFAEAGKTRELRASRGLPAVYISRFDCIKRTDRRRWMMSGGRVAIRAKASTRAQIEVSDFRIASLCTDATHEAATRIDVSGCVVLPGLINAHDHLEFGLFPNLGRGSYQNSKEWAEDIHASCAEEIALQLRVPKDVRLYWGALRNLLSGVTTVCHHNPSSPAFDRLDFPVRVVREIGWAHSVSFEPGAKKKYEDSPREWPFVIHASEGIDDSAERELEQLEELGLLDARTVLVHGLGCSREDIEKLNARGAGLVVCPSSNVFLFGRSVSGQIAGAKNLAIGTDSPLTACGDMLDELRAASDLLPLSSKRLYEICTEKAASLLRLRDGEGKLSVGGFADLLVVRNDEREPADTLLELNFEEIELVLVGGRVHFASESGIARIPRAMRGHLSQLRVDGMIVWVNAPIDWMFREACAVLGRKISLAGRRLEHVG